MNDNESIEMAANPVGSQSGPFYVRSVPSASCESKLHFWWPNAQSGPRRSERVEHAFACYKALKTLSKLHFE